MNFDFFQWVVIPAMIFLARILDVTLGTIRIIFVSKGLRIWAPILGFFEVLIWILTISQIMQNLTNPINYLAYAGGFATGNFVGIWVENKLAMGMALIRIITVKDSEALVEFLRGKDFMVTIVDAEGARGMVKVLFTVVKRKNIKKAVEYIRQFNPNAFYTIEEVAYVNSPILMASSNRKRSWFTFSLKRK